MSNFKSDWHEPATDDGTVTLEGREFLCSVKDSSGSNQIILDVQNISFNKKINTAKKLRITVEPSSSLTGEQYLGGVISVIVNYNTSGTANHKEIFEGDIKNITTNQQNDGYELICHSKGLRLNGVSYTENNVSNTISRDYIAKLIDAYNDPELSTMESQLDRETLSGGAYHPSHRSVAVESGSSTGTANYTIDGIKDSYPNFLYVKAYTPGSSSIDIEVDDGSNTYTETIDSLDLNKYGEWKKVDTSGLTQNAANDNITFTLNGDAILHHWSSVDSIEMDRIVEPTPIQQTSEEQLYTRGVTTNLKKDTVDRSMVKYDGDGLDQEAQIRQVSAWNLMADNTQWVNDTDATLDKAYNANENVLSPGFGFTTQNLLPEWELWARIKISDSGNGDDLWHADITIDYDGNATSEVRPLDVSNFGTTDYKWKKITQYNELEGYPDAIGAPIINIETKSGVGSDTVNICSIVLVDGKNVINSWKQSDFDNELTNKHLDYPHTLAYPEKYGPIYLDLEPYISDSNISWAETDAEMTIPPNTIDGENFGPEQTNFAPIEDSASDQQTFIVDEFITAGVDHQVRVYLVPGGDARSDTPRFGYEQMKLDNVYVYSKLDDIKVIHDRDVSDNILGSMNQIAEDSATYFRFEGSQARIFGRGELTTNPTLRKESITSSVSIEEVYASAELIGDGVSTGVVESDNAPNYVDEHKVIRDRTITDEAEANIIVNSFLQEHGTIRYTGNISTLPTFAPVGEFMDGSHFSHGQSMLIESVSYDMNRSTIKLGLDRNFTEKVLDLSQSDHNTKVETTGGSNE